MPRYLNERTIPIREHGRCGGFPVETISQIRTIIDPITAEPAETGA